MQGEREREKDLECEERREEMGEGCKERGVLEGREEGNKQARHIN